MLPVRPERFWLKRCVSLLVSWADSMMTLLPAARRTSPSARTVEPTTATSLPAEMLTDSPLSAVPMASVSCHASWVVVVLLLNVPFFFLVMSCTASCCSLAASRLTSLPAARVMPPSLVAADAAVRAMSLPAVNFV